MPGQRVHLTIEEKNQLREYYKSKSRLSLDDLVGYVQTKFKKKVGKSSVDRIVTQPMQTLHPTNQKNKRQSQFPKDIVNDQILRGGFSELII